MPYLNGNTFPNAKFIFPIILTNIYSVLVLLHRTCWKVNIMEHKSSGKCGKGFCPGKLLTKEACMNHQKASGVEIKTLTIELVRVGGEAIT